MNRQNTLHILPYLGIPLLYFQIYHPIEIQLLLCLTLIIHAVKLRGWNFVMLFWSGGTLYTYLHEYSAVNIANFYSHGVGVQLPGNISLFFLLFWPNLIYLILTISENVSRRNFFSERVSSRAYFSFILLFSGFSIFLDIILTGNGLLLRANYGKDVGSGLAFTFIIIEYLLCGTLFLMAFQGSLNKKLSNLQKFIGITLVSPIVILLQILILAAFVPFL